MKKFILLFLATLLFSCASQKQVVNSLAITTENVQCYNEYVGFKIEKIISDSRCPKDVQCIRLGEVEVLLSVYQGSKKMEEKQLTIDYKNFEKNKDYFESKLSLENRIISAINLTPEKIQGKKIEESDYVLQLVFSDKN